MTSFFGRLADRVRQFSSWPAVACVCASTFAVPAWAAIEVRVEARPASDPIQAFVTVTDDISGDPVEGLVANDFTVLIDGSEVTIGGFTLPPSQDDAQKVTVVFAMDYSESVTDVALAAMQQAVIDFSNAMDDGDLLAIVKFNNTNPNGASVVLPFTEIDHAVNNDAIEAAVLEDYPGNGTNILDALEVAVSQFVTPTVPLPDGPKAIVILSDGDDNASDTTQSEVVALANASSIPIFTIGVGDLSVPGSTELLTFLGTETGGEYFPTSTAEDIAEAYASISLLLSNEYLITIPNGIADCETHTLEVLVDGQPTAASVDFTRRTCDTEPDPFTFPTLTGVTPDRPITSDVATINGIEVPAHISVLQGRYSIGCTDDFTQQPGTIENGDTVCVRHQSANGFSESETTTLTIGGVAGTFTSTTRADNSGGGGGGGGGGGVTGLPELLFALGALLLLRRRVA